MKTTDLQDSLWAVVETEGAKFHYCPRQLVNELMVEMEERFGPSYVRKGVSEGAIDLPGMIMQDRPWEDIKIDTFTLSIPSQDFSYFLNKMENAEVRTFAGGKKYYKIHGWLHCVVFTPEQYYLVLEAMRDMKSGARERAEAADRKFSEGIARLNKGSGGNTKIVSVRDKYSEFSPIVHIPAPKKDNN